MVLLYFAYGNKIRWCLITPLGLYVIRKQRSSAIPRKQKASRDSISIRIINSLPEAPMESILGACQVAEGLDDP